MCVCVCSGLISNTVMSTSSQDSYIRGGFMSRLIFYTTYSRGLITRNIAKWKYKPCKTRSYLHRHTHPYWNHPYSLCRHHRWMTRHSGHHTDLHRHLTNSRESLSDTDHWLLLLNWRHDTRCNGWNKSFHEEKFLRCIRSNKYRSSHCFRLLEKPHPCSFIQSNQTDRVNEISLRPNEHTAEPRNLWNSYVKLPVVNR